MAFDLKDEEQAKQYLDNLGVEYRFQCFHERSPDGCHRLADFEESVRKDFEKAGKVYKTNCLENSYGHSCYKYGNYLLMGKGCTKDDKLAHEAYERGCTSGFMRACHNLALVTASGLASHTKNVPKAVQLFDKACAGGNADSCYQLSSIYIVGKENVSRDMTKASYYSEKACDMGVMYACANLSRMYTKGDGVTKDLDKARAFRAKATAIQTQLKENKHTLVFSG